MKYRNNFTYKMNYMMEILESEKVPALEEIREMYSWSEDKNPTIRCMLAHALTCRSDVPESEALLRKMTYDGNRMVRKAAVENLIIGRGEESLKRLKSMMQKTSSLLIRTYAVSSHFSVWLNIYGYNKKSMERYLEETEALYQEEQSILPMIAYENNRYCAGNRNALKKLQRILQGEMQASYKEQKTALETLESSRKILNRQEIDAALEEAYAAVSDCVLREEIEKVLKKPVLPMVMLLDQENSGLSQLLEYLAFQDIPRWKMLVFSFGVQPSEQISQELIHMLEKDYDIAGYQYPQKVWEQEYYDYVVPIGMHLASEDYSFQRVIPLFEEVEETMLDVEKAERMLDELKAYINLDNKKRRQDF